MKRGRPPTLVTSVARLLDKVVHHLVVDCGWGRLYVEVENDADSVRAGAAQAGAYAGTDPVGGIGLVVAPADHLPRPARLAAIRRLGVLVRAFDVDAGAFVDE